MKNMQWILSMVLLVQFIEVPQHVFLEKYNTLHAG